MRNIKFKSQDERQAQFAVALRKNVADYFQEKGISPHANWAMMLKTVIMYSFYLVPFILILTIPMSGWLAFGLAGVMGLGVAGIGMSVMHDGAHGAYSGKRWVNELMGGSMYLLGSAVFNWKIQHNVLHHTYTNIGGLDEDIVTRGPIRLCEQSPIKKIHRYQYIYAFFLYGLMTLQKLVRDFIQLNSYNKRGLTKAQRRNPAIELTKMAVAKAGYLALIIGLPLWLTEFSVWQVLAGFFLMHFVTGFILAVVFQLAHVVEGVGQPMEKTEGIIENEWIIHELETTANFGRSNRILGWYVGGLNFQVEHHLFPHICHIHYPQIAPIVERTALEFGYPYHVKDTFRDALKSHVRKLKELGTLKAA